MTTYFEDIKSYVGFGAEDAALLRALLPAAEPHFGRISEHFYECIQRHPKAHAALSGPAQVERLKGTLVEWMRSGLAGPQDEAFFERRARIGRVHVRIDLPQQYMFTAMNVMRLDFREVVDQVYADDAETKRAANAAVDKLFDLELAIMLETYREDSDDRLRRRERLATIGQLAANIAHDLRNPLGVIESSLYLLDKHGGPDPRVERHLKRIGSQVKLCGSIVSNLLDLARNRPPRWQRLDVGAVLDHALEVTPLPDSVRLERRLAPGFELEADAGLLAQALANLIGNATAALEGRSGTVVVTTRAEGPEGVIEISDDGPGFDPEVLSRVFEPLVTTRHTGIGLGLALVKNIVDRHGGTVRAGNRPEGGALVTVSLPLQRPTPAQDQTP
jgi:signal transduction histidine kinase